MHSQNAYLVPIGYPDQHGILGLGQVQRLHGSHFQHSAEGVYVLEAAATLLVKAPTERVVVDQYL